MIDAVVVMLAAVLAVQVEDVALEARVAQPGVLSMAGQALLREAHAALAEGDALAAAHALLRITRQDSADCDLLEQVHACMETTDLAGISANFHGGSR